MPIRFLTNDEVMRIHRDQIERYGGSLGLRDGGLLDAAITMPQQQFAGQYLHADLPSMAAAYLYHLAKNHPFIDGNKRVGAAAANVFLRMNGSYLSCTNDVLAELVLRVADGSTSKDEVIEFFRNRITQLI